MLTFEEKEKIFKSLKAKSGSHSPSISSLFREIPDLKVEVDACFLSNPYATELFFNELNKDLIETGDIFKIIEYYPAQNNAIAKLLGKTLNLPADNIFICNGAIEGIQAVLHRFVKDSIIVPIPTFSSYYEYVQDLDIKCYLFETRKENDYSLDLEKYSEHIKKNDIKNCVIINPNNPDGNWISKDKLLSFIKENSHLDNIIIDESFIHFTSDVNNEIATIGNNITDYPNLIIIKSLSKDFGIAGIRAGYVLMNNSKVHALLKNGYLWNSSGLAEYFFKKYSNENFRKQYEKQRLRYIGETEDFYYKLNTIEGLHIIKSNSNFFLAEITSGMTSEELFMELLFNDHVYVRDCSDKIGLSGNYVRIASRTKEENEIIFNSLTKALKHIGSNNSK